MSPRVRRWIWEAGVIVLAMAGIAVLEALAVLDPHGWFLVVSIAAGLVYYVLAARWFARNEPEWVAAIKQLLGRDDARVLGGLPVPGAEVEREQEPGGV